MAAVARPAPAGPLTPSWPPSWIPADVEVSFGWEQDPVPSFDASSPRSGTPSPREEVTSDERSASEAVPSLSNSFGSASSPSASPTLPTSSSSATTKAESSSKAEERQLALLIRSHSQGWARSFELHRDWPRPSTSAVLAEDEVLVRNVCVGLNPVDFKFLLYKFGIERFPWVLGRDVAGVVEAVGSDVDDDDLQKGDRVWTCSDSRDVRSGGFQEYSVHKRWTLGKLPTARRHELSVSITDEEGASIGTGLITAGVALYWFFDIPRAVEVGGGSIPKTDKAQKEQASKMQIDVPRRSARLTAQSDEEEEDQWLLVFGGGAITGIYAAQLAHLSAIKVLSIASPSNFDYLKSLGVTHCLDRFNPAEQLLEEIHSVTKGRLRYAIDCVGSTTAALCHRALQRADGPWDGDGQFLGLAGNPKRPRQEDEEEEEQGLRAVTTHRISFSTTFYGSSTWTKTFLSDVNHLFSSGSLNPVEVQVVPDGLAGVRKGLEMLRDGAAPRRKKLVVKIEETPSVETTHLGVKQDCGWNGCV